MNKVNSLVDAGRLSPRNKRTSGGRRTERYSSDGRRMTYDPRGYNNADGHEEREWRAKRSKELEKTKRERSDRSWQKFMDDYKSGKTKGKWKKI